MKKTEGHREEIKAELVRAGKSLKAAAILFEDGLFEDALSRAYYVILHAARAVLKNISSSVTKYQQGWLR